MYDIISGFFKIDSLYKTFYDLIITEDCIYLINLGQTFRAWLVNSDISHIKRNKMLDMNIDDIKQNFDVDIITKKDIKEINFSPKSFIKNGLLKIKTVDKEFALLSDKSFEFDIRNKLLN